MQTNLNKFAKGDATDPDEAALKSDDDSGSPEQEGTRAAAGHAHVRAATMRARV